MDTTDTARLFDYLNETIGPALGLGIIGTILFFLSGLVERNRRSAKKQVEDIATALSAEAKERQARASELLAEKLPPVNSTPELLAALEKLTARIALFEENEPSGLAMELEKRADEYQAQALQQASVQFWFSLMAAVVGFSMIVYVVATSVNSTEFQLIVKSLPGIAVEAVAALFFTQARETRQRATELYDRLRSDRTTLEDRLHLDTRRAQSLALVETIDDVNVRAAVKAQLALHLVGVESSLADFNPFLAEDKIKHPPARRRQPKVDSTVPAGNGKVES
jgi:hypothetical protein